MDKKTTNITKSNGNADFICTFNENGVMLREPSNNEIWYKSTDGQVVTPSSSGVSMFGANIVSNTYNGSLGIIKFDGDVTMIGIGAFYKRYTLSNVIIPNSVTSIGNYPFGYCSAMTSVSLGSRITSIGNEAFQGCTSLTSITIPNSVTSIGSRAFANCASLTGVTIPDSVTSIGQSTFENCSGMTSISFGSGITSIGYWAFKDCKKLSAFNSSHTGISSDNRCIGINGQIRGFAPANLTSYNIPSIYTSIGECVFQGCSLLNNITIPNSVTSIGEYAFYGCSSLTDITIPDSVTSIRSYGFDSCTSLTSFTCEATTPPLLQYDAFYDVPSTMSIYVPSTSVDAYKAASNWSERADYIQAIPTE